MLLSDEERYTIVLSAIRDYNVDENDIGILIVEKVADILSNNIDDVTDTQEIYNEIIKTFDYYNDFIKENKVDLKLIPDEMNDLVLMYINEVVDDVQTF